MKALLYDRYGGPEELRVAELREPRLAPWECLVRVHAASLNPADWKLMGGQWRFATGRRFPRRIGIDFAGTVLRSGTWTRGVRPGDRVMGMVNPLGNGSLAEMVAVPAAALSRVPQRMELEQAAALPVACATAWLALHHRCGDLRGQRVLLTGAGGGVGHFALQIAAREGAQVTAICSAGKAELCRQLGAARVVDYGRQDPLDGRERFDRILDCASSLSWARARRNLAPGGEFLFLDTGGRVLPFVRALASQLSPGRRQWTFLVTPNGRRGRMLAERVERLGLRVVVGGVFRLEEAAEAFRRLKDGHTSGKLLIQLESSAG